MAISLGATSEQLLRGIDRMIASIASLLPARDSRRRSPIPRAWSAERGLDIITAQVDVAGGFPGSLRWQQRLGATTLHLTDGWLIVGEGTAFGFALPLHRLAASAIQGSGGLKPPCLIVWYQDGDLIGSFSLTFRGTARNRTGLLRAEAIQQQLGALGIPEVQSELAQFSPQVHIAWDDIDDVVDDEVLFTGSALASVGGTFGCELDLAEVWITERAIIWCPAHGQGLNRLALDSVIECRNGFGDRLAIGIADRCGGRYDLFFDLGSRDDRSNPGARALQLLAAAGVPVGVSTPVVAPWRRGGTRRPSDI